MAPGNWVELNVHYNGVYVFLSYLVSVVGAWTTLEMMLKRTGSTGLWNVMLLIGAGIAFGSTATFGMHFVGNQAVTLRLPSPWEGRGVPLSYNAGYTILSLVVSCLSMILAFSFIGLRLSVPRWRSRLTDEEHGSTDASEKSVTREGEAYEDEVPDLHDNGFGEHKSPDLVSTGGAFDPDLKVDNGQQTRFALPAGRKMSLPTAFNIHLPKRGSKEEQEREKRRQEEEDEEDDKSEDGGDFGVHAASVSRWGVFKVLMAGIVCGGGIAAMHYVGQVSINSVPRVTNNWYTVLLSVIIAMACVSVGLYILFVIFRPKLEHSWYKRVIVAMILGVGVTLMHFVALLGTHYWAIEGQPLQSGNNNGTKTLIIALICVVAPVCCILLLIFAYFAQQRILRQRLARHRIILSTAIFDNQGLLLVQPESGLLPSAKIYPSKSSEQEKVSFLQMFGIGNRLSLQASKLKLARSDPAFIAFLKMSWAWRSKRGPVAGGTSAAFAGAPGLEQESAYGGPGSRSGEDGISSPRLSEAEDEMTGSEAEIMRRSVLSFEMASEEIAMQLTGENDLKVLGVMYDSILKIGHFQVSSKSSGDKFTVTQGQMLVLARRLKNNAEREALVARGFVFAEPGAVARVTSNAYAVPVERVFDYFRDVYRFTRFGIVKRLDRGRLYGGLLMLQALPGEGLHVVVDERQHHSLPMTELAALVDPKCDRSKFASYPHAIATLEDTVEALEELGGKSLLELVNTATGPKKDAAGLLCDAIVKTLRPHIERILSPENLNVLLSRINVAPQLIPLTSRAGPLYGGEGLVKDSYLICLKAVVPSSVTLPGARLSWLPFPLYQAQSDCVSKASGSTVSGPRPNTGGSVVEAARFGGGWSASSQASAGRKASVVSDHFGDSDLPFDTSSAAPFTSSAFPSGSASPLPSPPATSLHPLHTFNAPTGPSGQRGSTYTTSSNNEDEDDSPHSPRPMTGPQATDLPEGVPVYSPDWIVGLVRDAVRAPGHTMSHWDVPRADRKAKPRRSE